jgi:rod shape-determining protein MreC
VRDDKRTRLLLAVLLAAAFAMITVDARGGARSPLRPLRSGGEAVFGPVERTLATVARPATDLLHGIGHRDADRKQIAQLKVQNATLREQTETAADARARAAELDKLLHVASVGSIIKIKSRVLS